MDFPYRMSEHSKSSSMVEWSMDKMEQKRNSLISKSALKIKIVSQIKKMDPN
jgi:hypothetical protein